ncbi:MAG: ATP-binding protein [Parvularcula sp.]|jgi:signal transduction histidine kinase/CheY-like chemotaxis protein/tetratricopeptide (TPR) repeat protein|nr:ATP-binding protein [Parvularcula sp.]
MRLYLLTIGLAVFLAGQAAAWTQPSDPAPEALLDDAQARLIADPEAGLELARDAELSLRRGTDPDPDPTLMQRSAWLQAEALFRLNRLSEAAKLLETTLTQFPPDETALSGKLLITQGRIARARSDTALALQSFQNAFTIFNALDERRYMAISLQSIGILYSQARQFERAIDYDERAVLAYPEDQQIRAASLNLRGNAYKAMERYTEARQYFEAALDLPAFAAAPPLSLRLLSNIAALEHKAGNDEAVRELIERAEAIASGGDEEGVAYPLPRLLQTIKAVQALKSGETERAAALIDAAYAGVDLTTTNEDDREAHQFAGQVYAAAGRFDDAYQHLQAEKRLEDAERDLAASANLAILNAEFELSNKELEIANLKADRLASDIALVRAKRTQERLMTAAASIIGIGIIAFLVWQTYQSMKVRRQSEVMNKRLENLNGKLQRSNAELEKANSAKTEFLATTSHEIRTPLNAVINLTESVLHELPPGEPSHTRLQTALRSAEHLHAIVSDVLDVARFEGKRVQIHLSTVDLEAVTGDVIDLWRRKAAEKNVALEAQLDLAAPFFRTDERLIRQVLSNLVSNAIKFTQEGTINVDVSGGDEDHPLTIKVSDTGIGIAPEDQSIIFESFRQADRGNTRNFGGTGLGLAICHQITRLLGGSISVASKVGKGSTFTVELPFQERADVEKPVQEPVILGKEDIAATLRDLRILAAEDNQVNALVIQTILSGCVASLEIVENGAEALSAVEAGDYDVVLMDKQMPVMDGVEAVRRIRSLGGKKSRVPIIAVTADAFAAARDEILAAGADEYLSKPIRPDDLKSLIASTWTRTAPAAKRNVH